MKESKKYYELALRFIHTKYHFGTDPKRVWDIKDIAKLMADFHNSKKA